jgi:filamentous hemagglutinin family protein
MYQTLRPVPPRAAQRAALRRVAVPRPTRLAQAVACLLAGGGIVGLAQVHAQVLPTGPQVVHGQASVVTQGGQMTVRNSPGAIVNWQGFSIGAGYGIHFDQVSAASKVLNRVVGAVPSQILGTLTSNGAVWLLNPNGVLFGANARVDVASLVAGTLRLNDNDFLANSFRFMATDGSSAAMRNEGALNSSFGGQVVLLGTRVENSGSIAAPGGQIALVSSSSVELVDTALPHLSVRVDLPAGEVLNLGRLVAAGGRVDIHGAIVNQQGLVQATSLKRDASGEIVLRASDTLTLAAGSRTLADGAVAAADVRGGRIALLGAQVGVQGDAEVSASGAAGGGAVFVGGGAAGRDTDLPNARAVYIGPAASLRADALGRGDGGSIVLWSDAATRAYGRFSARGGPLGGNGGALETSGGWLDARPAALDLGAAAGLAGNWLLDPNNITISDNGPQQNISAGPNFTSTNDSSVITTATIASALNAGNSVTVSTASAGLNTQAGDIVMNGATLSVNPPVAVSLVLNADRNITFSNSTIASTGASLGLDMNAARSGAGAVSWSSSSFSAANGGQVRLSGQSVSLNDADIFTGGAPLALQFTTTGPSPQGVQLSNSIVSTGGGDVRFGNAQQVCSTALGCTTDAQAPWVQRSGDSSAAGLGLVNVTLDAGSGRVLGGGAGAAGVGVLLSGNVISARDLALAGRSDGLEGIRVAGGSHVATGILSLDGLNAGAATAGLSIQNGSTLLLSNASGAAGAQMSLTGSNKGASTGLLVSGGNAGSANETTISADGATLRMQGTASGVGIGLQAQGTAAAPGGLLIDALGASTATLSGSNLSTSGSGTLLSNLNLLGPQAVADNRLVVLGSGGAATGATPTASLQISGSTISSGSPVSVRGDGLSLANARITGDAGVSLLANTGASAPAGAPVTISGSTVQTSDDGAFLRIVGSDGTAVRGTANINSGVGVQVVDSVLRSRGSGSYVVFNGRGADSGGGGVMLARSTLSATNITGTGQGLVAGDGILAEDRTNAALTEFNATNLKLSGTSADPVDSLTHVGVKLSTSTVVNLTGRGAVDISGDYVVLGSNQALAPQMQMRGDPATVTVSSTASQSIRNATLDFSEGAGTTIMLLSDSDSQGGGRVRLDRATIRTGGGDFTITGGTGSAVGINAGGLDAAGNPVPLNSVVGEGATGAFFSGGVTLDAGAGKVSVAGQSSVATGDIAGSTSVLATGTNSIAAGSIDIKAIAKGPGVGLSVDNVNNGQSTLDLTADRITITAQGAGTSVFGTDPVPAQAVVINSASTWTARNGGPLTITSTGGPLAFTDATLNAGAINLTTPARLYSDGGFNLNPSQALNLNFNNPAGATIGGTIGTISTIGDSANAANAAGLSEALSKLAPGVAVGLKGPALTFTEPVTAVGRLNVQSDSLTLQSGARLASAASGDAVVISGYSTPNVGTFTNNAGASVLATPQGRWVLDLVDPRQATLGGLQASFTAYNLAARPWLADATGNLVTPAAGNAIGFAASTADIAASPLAVSLIKTYDATNTIALDPQTWTITGLLGTDKLTFSGSASALLADRNVGQGKAVTLDSSTQFTITDAAGRPVFGYATPVFKATVNPAPASPAVATSATQSNLVSSVAAVTVPTAMSTPTDGRVLDVMTALSTGDGDAGEGNVEGFSAPGSGSAAGGNQKVTFKSVNFQRLPRDEIQTLLAARASYKRKVFATSIARLEQDPALADVRGCRSAAELATGQCLLTEALKQEIATAAARAEVRARKGPARKVKQVVLPKIERKLALLVGINKYQDKAIPELAGALPDARAMRDLLDTRLGYETTLVEDGSREAIIRAFNRLALEADADDSVVIFYAGHGELVQAPGTKVETGYWLPADSDADSPESWISNADIERLVGLIGARQLMLISDSCYSGALAGTERVQVDQGASAVDLLSRKAAVVMSSGGEEPVADQGKQGHSVFTWYLMKSIGEVAEWQVGSSLFERVRAAVTKALPQTPQYGAARSAGHQGNTDYLFERREFETTP